MGQNVNYWKERSWASYNDTAKNAGITPLDKATYEKTYFGDGFNDNTNFEAGRKAWEKDIHGQLVDKYNTTAKNYANTAGLNYNPYTGTYNGNTSDVDSLINQIKGVQSQFDNFNAQTNDPNSITSKKKAKEDADAAKADALNADIEKKINALMASPATVDPGKVQKWQDFFNEQNKTNDANADTRLAEQFSALGDLGSSANRSALAQAFTGRQNDRANMALNLTQNDVNTKNQISMNSINQLMGLLGQENQFKMLPLTQNFQNTMQQNQNASQLSMANLQRGWQSQDNAQMMDFYNANKPAQQDWWQPLVQSAVQGGVTALTAGLL